MNDATRPRWTPPPWLLRAVIRYGCAVSMLPVTLIRWDQPELGAGVDPQEYARLGLLEIEEFLARPH